MQQLAEEEGVLAWSTADGNQIVVGKPNYPQPAQWFIVIPEPLVDGLRRQQRDRGRPMSRTAERYSERSPSSVSKHSAS